MKAAAGIKCVQSTCNGAGAADPQEQLERQQHDNLQLQQQVQSRVVKRSTSSS
jgi:hypothetical protein